MSARVLPNHEDPILPLGTTTLSITFDGEEIPGLVGQSLAGVIIASDRVGFRHTSKLDRPRGVFCGIGVCFDCLVQVNGLRDVRACQRRAGDGDIVVTQRDAEHHGGCA